MDNRPVRPTSATLPALKSRIGELTVERADIDVFELNPFSFYVIYDTLKFEAVDAKVQDFGKIISKDGYAEEPPQWALVSVDDHWFRAEVLAKYYDSNEECTGAEVSLIDTGRKKVIDIESIFPMGPELLTVAPAQCLRIFPKNVKSSSCRQLNILFSDYPKMKIRIKLADNLSMSSQRKPHSIGTSAEVFIGFKHWIPLEELLETFAEEGYSEASHVRDETRSLSGDDSEDLSSIIKQDDRRGPNRSSVSRETTNHSAESKPSERLRNSRLNNGTSERDVANNETSNSRGKSDSQIASKSAVSSKALDISARRANSTTQRTDEFPVVLEASSTRALGHGERRRDVRKQNGARTSKPVASISDSSDDDTAAETQKSEENIANISYHLPQKGIPTDVEGPNQGEIIIERSIANAKVVGKRNERRQKQCDEYRDFGRCPREQFCPFLHELPLEKVLTATGETIEFQDFLEINPSDIIMGFGVCSHVDPKGRIYLLLPYGSTSIWNVLNSNPLELEMLQLTKELAECYDYRKDQQRKAIGINEHSAVIWVDKPDSGPLRNVPQGWYRVKILSRSEKSCVVHLVDHGAELTVKMENIYPLDPSLRRFRQQAIPCCLQGTMLVKAEGVMFEKFRSQLLIFKLYNDCSPYNIELLSATNERSIHFGELLLKEGIVVSAL